MSIPPISAIGAAATAAKASSAFAAEMVQGASRKMGAFADVLAGSEGASDKQAVATDSSGGSSPRPDSITNMIEELKESLSISFEGSIELRLDGHGQISVTSESGFADQDFESRMKLQSHINGNDSIRTQVAKALTGNTWDPRVRL